MSIEDISIYGNQDTPKETPKPVEKVNQKAIETSNEKGIFDTNFILIILAIIGIIFLWGWSDG